MTEAVLKNGVKKIDLKNIDFKNIFPFLGLITIIVGFGIATNGRLFSMINMKAMLNDGLYILLGSVGYLFILAQGHFDFSIGSIMGISCAVGCVAASQIGPAAAIPAALLTGSIVGLLNGFIVAHLNIGSFIATLATKFIMTGAVLVILNGSIMAVPLSMLAWFSNPLKIMLIIFFLIIGYLIFQYTTFGKYSRAIGSCRETARQTGISMKLYSMAPFIIMGCIAGLLGFLSLIRTGSATNQTGSSLMTNVLNACLLGGIPLSGGATVKFRGVVIGTLTMTLLSSGMTILGLNSVNQQFVKGIVFLVATGISFDRKNLKVIK